PIADLKMEGLAHSVGNWQLAIGNRQSAIGNPSAAATISPSMSDPVVPSSSILIRSFRATDLPACQRLYVEGLIGGRIAENDTGFDIDDIESAYMKTPGNHFWVATAPALDGEPGWDPSTGEVIGMVGVQHHD